MYVESFMKKMAKQIKYDLTTTFGSVLYTSVDGNDSEISHVSDG